MKTKLYLDNCCFNRPYDDQLSLVVYLEAEAKLYVQQQILEGVYERVWSCMLDYENSANPYRERKGAIEAWRSLSIVNVAPSDAVRLKARELAERGIKTKDALQPAPYRRSAIIS